MNADDPGILCYQHKKNEPKVFCFNVPRVCKFCNIDLLISELRIPPFRIPYPFKNSSEERNALVIKPTFGDFLNNYESSSQLHIGVTDSEGFIVEYDANGLTRNKTRCWEQCLTVKIFKHMPFPLKHRWDKILHDTFINNYWTSERYNAEYNNCYSYVLSFLKSLGLKELEPYICDKITFCQQFVSPQARAAAKYISIFRELKGHF